MAMTPLKARLDVLIWALVYAGLFACVLGLAIRSSSPATGWSLIGVGAVATAVGVVLIWVRSRLGPDN